MELENRSRNAVTDIRNLAGWNNTTYQKLKKLIEEARQTNSRYLTINGYTIQVFQAEEYLKEKGI
jgi:hypothetical protein